jgi:NAD-dependent dihydropyrimidine dehydrogenase PreA subunit
MVAQLQRYYIGVAARYVCGSCVDTCDVNKAVLLILLHS